jgi:hypothetical protein
MEWKTKWHTNTTSTIKCLITTWSCPERTVANSQSAKFIRNSVLLAHFFLESGYVAYPRKAHSFIFPTTPNVLKKNHYLVKKSWHLRECGLGMKPRNKTLAMLLRKHFNGLCRVWLANLRLFIHDLTRSSRWYANFRIISTCTWVVLPNSKNWTSPRNAKWYDQTTPVETLTIEHNSTFFWEACSLQVCLLSVSWTEPNPTNSLGQQSLEKALIMRGPGRPQMPDNV